MNNIERIIVLFIVQPLSMQVEELTGKNCFSQAYLSFVLQVVTGFIYTLWLLKIDNEFLVLSMCLCAIGVYSFKQTPSTEKRRRIETATGMENEQLEKTERCMYLLPFLFISLTAFFLIVANRQIMPVAWLAIPLFFGYVGEALLACSPNKFNR